MIKAVYAGTFDPPTLGHLDIIGRSLKFCDRLTVAVGINSSKKTLFTVDERLQMIDQVAYTLDFLNYTYISVLAFDGLLIDFAKQMGASILIRGIRSVSDFEYEINLASVNKILAPNIETVFLPTSPELAVVSSSAVKEIARYGGDVSKFVSVDISKQLKEKFFAPTFTKQQVDEMLVNPSLATVSSGITFPNGIESVAKEDIEVVSGTPIPGGGFVKFGVPENTTREIK